MIFGCCFDVNTVARTRQDSLAKKFYEMNNLFWRHNISRKVI